jgi:hypothetical protein
MNITKYLFVGLDIIIIAVVLWLGYIGNVKAIFYIGFGGILAVVCFFAVLFLILTWHGKIIRNSKK